MAQSIRDYLESIISATDALGTDATAMRIRQTARAAIQQMDKELVGVLENSVFSPETVTAIAENKELSAKFQQTIDSYKTALNDFNTWFADEYGEDVAVGSQNYYRLKEAYTAGRNSRI